MALDLTTLGKQIRQMSDTLAGQARETSERSARMVATYLGQTGKEETWKQAVNLSRETAAWLFALPVEPFDTAHALPAVPPAYHLVASDGSQIDIDRHGAAACYLINTGRVYLRYGDQPAARLTSQPALYYLDKDLYLTDGARRIPIEGNYLSVRRDVEELQAVVGLADEYILDHAESDSMAADIPALALQDGTLVRWPLAGAEKFVQQHFLRPYLDGMEHLGQRDIPLASYISRPRAAEMVGTVRLMYCPDVNLAENRGAKCSVCSDVQASRPPSCNVCNGLMDADLLANRLAEGQRGPLFVSMSRINVEAYEHHMVHFFYLRVGRELARVELPRRVAQDRAKVDLVHSLIYDQCVKGQGYPVALARAHEQAIVRSADRRTFQRMIEGSLLRAELPATASRKQESKERAAL
jgi:hypothetical protein